MTSINSIDNQIIPPEKINAFECNRAKIIGLAYRITGSSHDADDIAQECFIKWMAADSVAIRSPRAWLLMVATRISLDYLKSARTRRKSYEGQWLPEPFIDYQKSPEEEHELDESLSMALLLLLEQLTLGERAAYILHDIFQYDFDEIGIVLEKTTGACRKLASRARKKISMGSVVFQKTDKEEHLQIISAFFKAVKKGELRELTTLLSDNVILTADGGGKAVAIGEILQGMDSVANFLLHVMSPNPSGENMAIIKKSIVWFNGAPGVVIWSGCQPVSAFNFEIGHRRIERINVLRNPDKLRFFKIEQIYK